MPRGSDLAHLRHDLEGEYGMLMDAARDAGRRVPSVDVSRFGRELLACGALRAWHDGSVTCAEMPLYVIDSDVMRLAADVLYSTGPMPGWFELVPTDALLVWDADALGDAAPVMTEYATNRSDGRPCMVRTYPSGTVLLRGRTARGDRALRPYPILRSTGRAQAWVSLEDGPEEHSLGNRQSRLLEPLLCRGVDGMVREGMCANADATRYVGAVYDRIAPRIDGTGRWWVCGGATDLVSSAFNADVAGSPASGSRCHWLVSKDDARAIMDAGRSSGWRIHGHDLSMVALLACVFALRQHPELVGSRDDPEVGHLSRQQRRRLERDGVDTAALQRRQVTTIHLREQPARPASDPAPGHRDVQYGCRWIVHGHFTHQPCGPNRSERRLTWIAPYIKGPAGKPLKSDLERTVNIRL